MAIAFENKRGEIARLDEVLTMSARLYAATGDTTWRDRYLMHVEPLDRVLGDAPALAANDQVQEAIDQVADSNTVLIALEETSLKLTAAGRLSEALATSTSADYQKHKVNYGDGLTKALKISHGILQDKVRIDRAWLVVAACVLMSSPLLPS